MKWEERIEINYKPAQGFGVQRRQVGFIELAQAMIAQVHRGEIRASVTCRSVSHTNPARGSSKPGGTERLRHSTASN